jgi:hypothetical protein
LQGWAIIRKTIRATLIKLGLFDSARTIKRRFLPDNF